MTRHIHVRIPTVRRLWVHTLSRLDILTHCRIRCVCDAYDKAMLR